MSFLLLSPPVVCGIWGGDWKGGKKGEVGGESGMGGRCGGREKKGDSKRRERGGGERGGKGDMERGSRLIGKQDKPPKTKTDHEWEVDLQKLEVMERILGARERRYSVDEKVGLFLFSFSFFTFVGSGEGRIFLEAWRGAGVGMLGVCGSSFFAVEQELDQVIRMMDKFVALQC